MTYASLQSVINTAFATFSYNYVVRERLGADNQYSEQDVCFVKAIYNTLMHQRGDENLDLLSKENIQQCIILFNKYSNSIVPIEYT